MRCQPEICAGYLHAREGRPTVTSSHLGASEAARCGAQIDAASPAFVLSLGNSKSIFLTFFYLFAQTSLPPPPDSQSSSSSFSSICLTPPTICMQLRRGSPIASLHLLLGYFLPSPLSLLCLSPAAGLPPQPLTP